MFSNPNKKTRKKLLALSAGMILAFSLAMLPASFGSQKAYAHGSPPGTCGNEYDYTIESFTIDNMGHTFDVLEEEGLFFNGNNAQGYDVTVTIHAASQSSEGNTLNGSIWYHTTAFGFGNGVCVYDIMPDEGKTIVIESVVPAQQTSNVNANGEEMFATWDFRHSIQYTVNWFSDANYPTNTGTASITIEARNRNSSDWTSNQIDGLYVNLTQNGQLVDSGFTPVTFTLETGAEYEIGVADYGSYHFYHWSDIWDEDAIRPIKIADAGHVGLIAYYIVKEDSEPTDTASTTSELTVSTKDGTSGNAINGYWTVLSKDGSTVATGFSPATFTLDNNEDYVVSVADYGQYVFDHWQDSSSARDRSISISSDDVITAVYRNANSPSLEQPPDDEEPPSEEEQPAPEEDSTITISSIDRNSGNEIAGYYTALFDDSGNVIGIGFTPATFDVTDGQEYTIEVQDYGSYYFNYWQDNDDTDRNRTFTADGSSLTLTAVYDTSPNAAPPEEDNNSNEDEEEEQPSQQTTGTISVTTVDSSGSQISGYYTTLSQNGNVVQTGFSPAEFTVDGVETYQVAVADYGSYVFDHWSDGSTGRFHDAEAGDDLAAVYRN